MENGQLSVNIIKALSAHGWLNLKDDNDLWDAGTIVCNELDAAESAKSAQIERWRNMHKVKTVKG